MKILHLIIALSCVAHLYTMEKGQTQDMKPDSSASDKMVTETPNKAEIEQFVSCIEKAKIDDSAAFPQIPTPGASMCTTQ